MSADQYASLAFRVTSLETFVIALQSEMEELRKQLSKPSIAASANVNTTVQPTSVVEEEQVRNDGAKDELIEEETTTSMKVDDKVAVVPENSEEPKSKGRRSRLAV